MNSLVASESSYNISLSFSFFVSPALSLSLYQSRSPILELKTFLLITKLIYHKINKNRLATFTS